MPKPEVIEKAFEHHPYRFNNILTLGDGWVFGPAFIVWEPNFHIPKARPKIYRNLDDRALKRIASRIINAAPKKPDPEVQLDRKGHPHPHLKTPCKGRTLIIGGEPQPWEASTAHWRLYTGSFCDGFAFDAPVLYGYHEGKLRVVTTLKQRVRCWE
jgi:hypothetical protein